MKIETKYNIGDRVWIVQEGSYYDTVENKRKLSGEIEVFDDFICAINIEDNNKIIYILKGADMIDLEEKEVILYKDKTGLLHKIEEIMDKIHEREKGE